jgi:hypothetical protein
MDGVPSQQPPVMGGPQQYGQQQAPPNLQHLQQQQQQQLHQMIAQTQQRQQQLAAVGLPVAQPVAPPVPVDPQLQRLPIRAYLDQTVVPILLDGACSPCMCVCVCVFLRIECSIENPFPASQLLFSLRAIARWSAETRFARIYRHVRTGQGTSSKCD